MHTLRKIKYIYLTLLATLLPWATIHGMIDVVHDQSGATSSLSQPPIPDSLDHKTDCKSDWDSPNRLLNLGDSLERLSLGYVSHEDGDVIQHVQVIPNQRRQDMGQPQGLLFRGLNQRQIRDEERLPLLRIGNNFQGYQPSVAHDARGIGPLLLSIRTRLGIQGVAICVCCLLGGVITLLYIILG